MRSRTCPLLCAILLGCTPSGASKGQTSGENSLPDHVSPNTLPVTLEPVYPDLKSERPLVMLFPPGDPASVLVVEQAGRILRFDRAGTGANASVWLDIRSRVISHGELGLLGMALHPSFSENGEVFLYYTVQNPLRSVVSRWMVSRSDLTRLDPSSEAIILEVIQPFSNHNGGCILFGPDGYLYIALGDGGAGGDPHGNGQNTRTLLGSILRIDVQTPAGKVGSSGDASGAPKAMPGGAPATSAVSSGGKTSRYSIPPDNPFADGVRGRPEIFAWGLRNPWRMAFDRSTGSLWAGDVGQGSFEEIDLVEKGRNYGWNILEGNSCFNADRCNREGLTPPVAVYGRDQGISVTGGVVYRGNRIPNLQGHYLFADFGSGRLWNLPTAAPRPTPFTLLKETGLNIASFAEDDQGEVYLLHHGGSLFRLGP